MQLSKSDFKQFCQCKKSLWLKKHKPDTYNLVAKADVANSPLQDGYIVEGEATQYFKSLSDADAYLFQQEFKSPDGLYARSDIVKNNPDGSINIYEIKSSTKLKTSGVDSHLIDAAFQKIAAEKSGHTVDQIYVVYLNKSYVKNGHLDRKRLFIVENVTKKIDDSSQIYDDVNAALKYLKQLEIDESYCECLYLSRSQHCDCFAHFNQKIPENSIYILPRIRSDKIKTWAEQNIFSLLEIDALGLNKQQTNNLKSAKSKKPVIDYGELKTFISGLTYPLYFLDFEAFSSALPIIDGLRPHQHLVFQFSLHIKNTPDETVTQHHEYLSETAVKPEALVKNLRKYIGNKGSVVSWHASYENSKIGELQAIYPEYKSFLESLKNRSADLESVFIKAYFDYAFGGSTSIKKVLPVLIPSDPELDYSVLDISNGTQAMEAWKTLIQSNDINKKYNIKKNMLKYCRLDTLAMVRIFEKLQSVLKHKSH